MMASDLAHCLDKLISHYGDKPVTATIFDEPIGDIRVLNEESCETEDKSDAREFWLGP